MTRTAYSRRAVLWLAALGTVSLLAFVALLVFGEELGAAPSPGADAYSRSALGHAGFVAFVRRLGHPVLVSRWRSDARAPKDALLVLAEPEVHERERGRKEMLRAVLDREGPVLAVLPKRVGTEDDSHPGWLSSVRPIELPLVQDVLDALTDGEVAARVHRRGGPSEEWQGGEIRVAPTLAAPQLLDPADGLEPLVAGPAGVLVARVERAAGPLFLLSDPDVLANHGLARGDNAVLLARVLAAAVPPGGTVVVDETLHGGSLPPSIARELFRWPLVLAVLQAAIAAFALLLAAVGRHGAPSPEEGGVPAGKRVLLENTADLLHSGGHHAHVLKHYLDGAVQHVLRATHAPPGLSRAEADEWIARARRSRGVERTLEDLRTEVGGVRGSRGTEAARAVATARRIHAWRREMIDGPVGGS
jgi:hypothetical protein